MSSFAAEDGAGAESLSRLAADEVIEPTAFTSLDVSVVEYPARVTRAWWAAVRSGHEWLTRHSDADGVGVGE